MHLSLTLDKFGENVLTISICLMVSVFQEFFTSNRYEKHMNELWTKPSHAILDFDQLVKNGYIPCNSFKIFCMWERFSYVID